MKLLNRCLGCEVALVHVGHGALYVGAIVLVALELPWWALLVGAPLILFSVLGWAYEGYLIWPLASRLLRGESALLATGGGNGRSNNG